jgi:uncharacterized membrane protein
LNQSNKSKIRITDFLNLGTVVLIFASLYFANKGNNRWAYIFLGILIFLELLSFLIIIITGIGVKMIMKDASRLLIKINKIREKIKDDIR